MKWLAFTLIIFAVSAPQAGATAFLGMRTGPNLGSDKVDAAALSRPSQIAPEPAHVR
jgi:hypothetical protein